MAKRCGVLKDVTIAQFARPIGPGDFFYSDGKERQMKLDFAKTNGSSPPSDNLARPQHFLTPTRDSEEIRTVRRTSRLSEEVAPASLDLTHRRVQERSECPLLASKSIHSACGFASETSSSRFRHWPRMRGVQSVVGCARLEPCVWCQHGRNREPRGDRCQ